MRSSPSTVRQLTVAAMLGTLPTVGRAQQQRPTRDTSSRASNTHELPDSAAEPVRVAARRIPRGSVLSALDIAYANSKPLAQHPVPHSVAALDSATTPCASDDLLIGWSSRRVINAGEPLRAPAVSPPQLVKSGDIVELVWQQGGVVVTTKGRVTRSASEGERVLVRLSSARAIEGSVVGSGRVRVE